MWDRPLQAQELTAIIAPYLNRTVRLTAQVQPKSKWSGWNFCSLIHHKEVYICDNHMDQKIIFAPDDSWCRNPDSSLQSDLSEPFLPYYQRDEEHSLETAPDELPTKRRSVIILVFTIANTMLGSTLLV